MSNSTLIPIDGIIQNISTPTDDCCQQQVTIRNAQGVYNFIVGPDTYVIGSIRLREKMGVRGILSLVFCAVAILCQCLYLL